MEWIKKHTDTVIVLGAIVSSILWMNGRFNEVDIKFSSMEKEFNERFTAIEKDIAIIKTVMVMKDIMPKELAKEEK